MFSTDSVYRKNRRGSEAVRQAPTIEQCSVDDNSQILVRRETAESAATGSSAATALKASRTPVGSLCKMQKLAIAWIRYISMDTTIDQTPRVTQEPHEIT